MNPEELYNKYEKIVYVSINELIKYKENFCFKKGMTIEDLEQYGRLALWKACLKCKDESRLASYAYMVVKGAIKDLIFNMTPIHLIRLPYRNTQDEREEVASYLSVDKENDETGLTMLDELPSPYTSVENYVLKKIELEEKLSALAEKQKEYLLEYLQGYSTAEIAKKRGLQQYGVSTTIKNAVRVHNPQFDMSLRKERGKVV